MVQEGHAVTRNILRAIDGSGELGSQFAVNEKSWAFASPARWPPLLAGAAYLFKLESLQNEVHVAALVWDLIEEEK